MAARKTLTTYTKARTKLLTGLGDSLTFTDTFWLCAPHKMYPTVLADSLNGLSIGIRAQNEGVSGDTTTQMLARIANVKQYGTPVVLVVFGGVNDPGAPIVGATTQSNLESIVEAAIGYGVSYVVMLNTQYLNWTTGGDTLVTPYATYATLRTFQAAAAASRIAAHPGRVAYCDTYTYMRNLIVAGTETQGSNSWHAQADNQHLNALGQSYIAAAVLATIQAQSGWITALQA